VSFCVLFVCQCVLYCHRVATQLQFTNTISYNTDEVTTEWRRTIHKEGPNDPNSSPNIVRVIKSKIMRWAGKGARMGGRKRCILGFSGET
jgi:hypothetical protein